VIVGKNFTKCVNVVENMLYYVIHVKMEVGVLYGFYLTGFYAYKEYRLEKFGYILWIDSITGLYTYGLY
jgi:hypothetical protein